MLGLMVDHGCYDLFIAWPLCNESLGIFWVFKTSLAWTYAIFCLQAFHQVLASTSTIIVSFWSVCLCIFGCHPVLRCFLVGSLCREPVMTKKRKGSTPLGRRIHISKTHSGQCLNWHVESFLRAGSGGESYVISWFRYIKFVKEIDRVYVGMLLQVACQLTVIFLLDK